MLGDQKGVVSIWDISRVIETLKIKEIKSYAAMKMSFSLRKEEINAAPIFRSEIQKAMRKFKETQSSILLDPNQCV